MIINHMILHIMDFKSDICAFSQREMNLDNTSTVSFVEKHIQHIQKNTHSQAGIFKKESWFCSFLAQYCSRKITFIDFSRKVADILYNNISISDKKNSLDILMVDFSNDEQSYLAFLLLDCKHAYTHQVSNQEGVIENSIIDHYAILPNTSQKIDSYAIVNKGTETILFSDKRRYIEGKDVFVIPEKVLQCSVEISSNEALKTVTAIAATVAETYGENTAVVLSKAKNYIVENAEISRTLSPSELGQELFSESEELQGIFEAMVEEAQLPKEVEVTKTLAIKTGRNHKIKTDTGIEITFPAEYFENHEYIEFINNADGTISIQLKNIGKIINK